MCPSVYGGRSIVFLSLLAHISTTWLIFRPNDQLLPCYSSCAMHFNSIPWEASLHSCHPLSVPSYSRISWKGTIKFCRYMCTWFPVTVLLFVLVMSCFPVNLIWIIRLESSLHPIKVPSCSVRRWKSTDNITWICGLRDPGFCYSITELFVWSCQFLLCSKTVIFPMGIIQVPNNLSIYVPDFSHWRTDELAVLE